MLAARAKSPDFAHVCRIEEEDEKKEEEEEEEEEGEEACARGQLASELRSRPASFSSLLSCSTTSQSSS